VIEAQRTVSEYSAKTPVVGGAVGSAPLKFTSGPTWQNWRSGLATDHDYNAPDC
jgi:hypothetical protein